jgi:hypothetical protein
MVASVSRHQAGVAAAFLHNLPGTGFTPKIVENIR